MAIEQKGSIIYDGGTTSNTGSITGITVPADTELVLVTAHGFKTEINHFSGGGMTFTKGATQVAMTPIPGNSGGDSSTGAYQGTMYYLTEPDIGASKTLEWDWAGAGDLDDGVRLFTISFWGGGIDLASPIAGGGGTQSAIDPPWTTPSIAGGSGDLAVGVAWGLANGAEGSVTFTNLTSLEQRTAGSGNMDTAYGTSSPSGSQTYAVATATNFTDGGLLVAVLNAAGGGGGGGIAAIAHMLRQD